MPSHTDIAVRYGSSGLTARTTAETGSRAYAALGAAGFTAVDRGDTYVPKDETSVIAARAALTRLLTACDGGSVTLTTDLDPDNDDHWKNLPAPQGWAHHFSANRADLAVLARGIADRLPGTWTVSDQDWTLIDNSREDTSLDLWDGGSASWATWEYHLPRAAVLTRGDLRLLLVDNPSRQDRFVVGAMVLPGVIHDFLADPAAPRGISVPGDPARAAHRITARLLPRYEQEAWRVRVQALVDAAEGIQQATAAWDAVSDSYCDADGWPVDVTGYEEGKVARDAAAWKHVETFLAHGPEVHAGIRACLTADDYLAGPIREDLQRLRGLDTVLTRASAIHREWEEVAAIIATAPPSSRETYLGRARELRNEDGWHYADELASSGAALARAAQHLTDRISTERPAPDRRVAAALSRSAADRTAAPPTSPTPPAAPHSSAVRCATR